MCGGCNRRGFPITKTTGRILVTPIVGDDEVLPARPEGDGDDLPGHPNHPEFGVDWTWGGREQVGMARSG